MFRDLHSNMDKLKVSFVDVSSVDVPYLHSNMDKLKGV